MNRVLAFILAAVLLLAACGSGGENPPASPSSQEGPSPASSTPEEPPSLPFPSDEDAKTLTEVIIRYGLRPGAAEGWHGEEELLELTTFALCAPVLPEHPYRSWFPMEGDGLRCFPREALHQMVWEVFGIENWDFPEDLVDWNEEKGRFESTVEFGISWGAFQPQGELTAAWRDDRTVTVTAALTKAGSVNGDPGYLPLGDAVFTYRRMEEGQRAFWRLLSVEVEGAEAYRYDTVPGVEVPDAMIGKITYENKYVGHGGTVTEPSAVNAVMELLGKVRVLDLPDEPPNDETRPFGFEYYQFFLTPEDENPAFTIYLNPFCVEAGGQKSGFYQIDDSFPGEEKGLFAHIFSELEATSLKRSRAAYDGSLLYQIPFVDEADGSRRTINLFLPGDWRTDGYDVNLPGEGDSKLLEFHAYAPDSESIQRLLANTELETRWIAGRNYWCLVENYTILSQSEKVFYPYAIRRYYFLENGYYYEIAFFQNLETMPVATEDFEETLWGLVYIQSRGPDEMADVVLEERAVIR